MTERNYYDILGLTPSADGTTVNRTYWLLARRYQGEAASDPRAHHLLDELNEAYGVLGTPVLREAYDAAHPAADETEQSSSRQDAARPSMRRIGLVSSHEANINALAPYAMALALGAVSVVAGMWSGSPLLAALGTCAALVAGVALARHKIARIASVLAVRTGRGRAESTSEPAPERALASDGEPIGAPIVGRRGVPVDELRLSTASMVGRWRSSAGATAHTQTIDGERGPDSTLVDIFRSEQELESPSEPLSAVLDVLRGSRRPV